MVNSVWRERDEWRTPTEISPQWMQGSRFQCRGGGAFSTPEDRGEPVGAGGPGGGDACYFTPWLVPLNLIIILLSSLFIFFLIGSFACSDPRLVYKPGTYRALAIIFCNKALHLRVWVLQRQGQWNLVNWSDNGLLWRRRWPLWKLSDWPAHAYCRLLNFA